MKRIHEHEGRSLFGLNPDGYDQVRPAYPESLFSLLVDQGALFPNASTLEIGPGNGLATRRLIAHGVNPLTVVEPDKAFEGLLSSLAKQADCDFHFVQAAFEDTLLQAETYDLMVAATVYHWLNPLTRVNIMASLLKPLGHVALMWNVFQNLHQPDPFHEATKSFLAHLAASPSGAPDTIPFALDRRAREAEFLQTGKFEVRAYLEVQWTLQLNTAQVGLLYEGFSSIARLSEVMRNEILNRLMDVADTKFDGIVKRNMTSPLYLFQRV
jgi:SAM-dependent methyltransferase